MPSKSENQQQLMAMALMYKRGKLKNASDTVKSVANNMSEKELEKYATTATKGLPKKISKENVMTIIEKFIVKQGNSYRIRSAKTGKLWPQKYDSYANALSALKAYQVHKNEVLSGEPIERLKQLETIVKTNSAGRVGNETIDVASANTMLAVYESLVTLESKKKFLSLSVKNMIEVAYKIAK
jgi:hypothetical protein